jgi:hypothetical protein
LLFIEITPGHDWRHDGAIGFVALRLKGAALESKGWQTKLAGIPKFVSPFGEIDYRSCSRRNFISACLYGGNEAFVTVQKISKAYPVNSGDDHDGFSVGFENPGGTSNSSVAKAPRTTNINACTGH